MALCSTLAKVQRSYVDFDPMNHDHQEAFRTLCLGEDKGYDIVVRQHPTLRFHLVGSFHDIRSMMFHMVGEAFLAQNK